MRCAQVGVAAAAINSTISREEQAALLGQAAAGAAALLYVAPERFGDGGFMAALRQLRRLRCSPSTKRTASPSGATTSARATATSAACAARIGNPPIVALTATADPRVRDDIVAAACSCTTPSSTSPASTARTSASTSCA